MLIAKAKGGSTAMKAALQKVIVRVKTRPKVKKALFIMSDGKPNTGKGVSPEKLAHHLKRRSVGKLSHRFFKLDYHA